MLTAAARKLQDFSVSASEKALMFVLVLNFSAIVAITSGNSSSVRFFRKSSGVSYIVTCFLIIMSFPFSFNFTLFVCLLSIIKCY